MTKDECYEVGYVVKTHGLKGELGIHLDVENPQDYTDLDGFLIEKNGELIPYFIERIRINQDKAIVKFEELNSIEEAQPFVKKTLYLDLDNLDELEEGQFYYHDIIGYTVIDEIQGTLGTIATVYTQAHQDLIAMNYKGAEVLIPVSDEHVKGTDNNKKELYVNLPEGLVEMYTELNTEKPDHDELQAE
jgi:16S rRNA processing protein RimM